MRRAQGSRPDRGPRRRRQPSFEALDGRLLLSGVTPVGGKLGPFIAPGAIRPRIQQAPVRVDASPAVNQYLVQLLGPDAMEPIRAQAAARGVAGRSMLHQAVLAQPFVNAMLGSVDTYTLLNSPAAQALVGFSAAPEAPPEEQEPVQFLVPESNLLFLGPTEATIQIPPAEGRAAFTVTVPIGNLQFLGEGFYQVAVPVDQIPGEGVLPPSETIGTGALSSVYRQTGPLMTEALRTGRPFRGLNTPPVVRGLRLARSLGDPRLIPPGTQANYLRLLRVAVERNAFDTSPEQSQRITDELESFLFDVQQLSASGAFTPVVPPATPANMLGGARLGNTIQITSGAVRDLVNVAPSQTGLQLFGLNFPGRIDSGIIIAANGDYGLVLSARGPMQDAPAGFSTDTVGGDLRVQLSNAQAITELNGLRIEEGTYLGSVISGEITASRTPIGPRELVTLGAAAGFGTGLDFGTTITYTRVIPLGNLNALIPQYPAP
ncbi:hypothetical protein [Tautonia marina]|uniref:hypothetical protein n=1 Tax=Tautonia marina TaxID=2653855 RepID=UPI001260C73A|nr:hypothetical protein [Tautonia marina]